MNRKPTLKSSLQALLYLAPALVFMTTFTIIPIIRSFMMSFYENYKLRNITKNKPVVWSLDNFQKILADQKFYLALQNTATYVFWVVLCSITISVTVAVLLNQIPFSKGSSEPPTSCHSLPQRWLSPWFGLGSITQSTGYSTIS